MKRTLVSGILATAAVAACLVFPAAARAADDLTATVNGRAEAAAVFVPFRVNPNLELYPAYSLSEVANSASQSSTHGVSAGFYPGFLLDAFLDFYGFKGPGRALLGFAESQWPDPPQEANASTADFGTLCKESGSNEQITQYFPKQLFDGCQQFYAALTGGFGGSLPYKLSTGHSESAHLASSGVADGFQMTLPLPDALTIAHARSTSDTHATGGSANASEATAVLRDVSFGPLHIAEIRSVAKAVDDATKGHAVERSIQIAGATLAGQGVTIDEQGIAPVNDNPGLRAAIEQFAAQGFVVELVQGHDSVDPDSGEVSVVSGGLQLRMIRGGTPPELQAPTDQLCAQTTELQNSNAVLAPDSLYTLNYDLEAVPPVNDAYQQAWDEHYPLGLVLPRDLEGTEPVPPVIPCAGVLFDRAVDAGVVLGVATASARFVEGVALPDLDGVLSPGIPDRYVTTTTTIPGTLPGVAPPAGPGTQPAALAAPPGLGAGVADRVKLVYGVLMIFVASLVFGRAAFKRLVRT